MTDEPWLDYETPASDSGPWSDFEAPAATGPAQQQTAPAPAADNPAPMTWGDRLWSNIRLASQGSFGGQVAQKLYDWTNYGHDELKKKFPDASDDEIEGMADKLITEARRATSEEIQARLAQDPAWKPDDSFWSNLDRSAVDFIGGLVGSSDPSMALNPGGTPLMRMFSQGVISGAADAGYQGLNLSQGYQDEFSPESVGQNILFGVAGQGLFEIPAFTKKLFGERGADTTPGATPEFEPSRLSPEAETAYQDLLNEGSAQEILDFFKEQGEGFSVKPADVYEFIIARDQGKAVNGPIQYIQEGQGELPLPPEQAVLSLAGGRMKATGGVVRPEVHASPEKVQASVDSAVAHINDKVKDWTNAPEYEVHANFDELPDLDPNAIGVTGPDGKILINLKNVEAEARVSGVEPSDILTAVTFHEGLGHTGLTQKFGDELDNVLDDLYARSPDLQARADAWMKENPDAYVDDPNPTARAVEEILAEQSEAGKIDPNVLERFRAWLRGVGRTMGLDLDFNDNEVKVILGMAHRAVTDGKFRDVTGNGYRNKILYHGSGADFNEFDHSKMGSGEGAQVYGWGTYLTETPAVAERYRSAIGGDSVQWKKSDLPIYAGRRNMQDAVSKAFPDNEATALSVADTVFNFIAMNRGKKPTPREVVDDLLGVDASPKDKLEVGRFATPIVKFVNDNLNLTRKGKTYEVDVPDNANWLEWDKTLGEQPELLRALKDAGEKIQSYEDWSYVERRYYEARSEYDKINNELERASFLADDVEASPRVREKADAEADRLFQDLQKASKKRAEWKKEYEDQGFHENMSGEGVYARLVKQKGSPEAASKFLNENGIEGTKYLDGMSRNKREGSYNYVMYNDKTPKIVNKYMRRKTAGTGSEGPLGGRSNADDLENKGPTTPIASYRSKYNVDEILNEAMPEKERQSFNEWIDKAGETRMTGKIASSLSEGTTPAELLAAEEFALKSANRIRDLQDKVGNGTATAAQRAAFARELQRLDDVVESIMGVVSNASHIMNARKITVESDRKLQDTVRNMLIRNPDILSTPEGIKEVAKKLAKTDKQAKTMEKALGILGEAVNLPRTLMSTADFSAPFRQGFALMGRKEFWKALLPMFKWAVSEKSFQSMSVGIKDMPNYRLMKKGGLYLADIDGHIVDREEQFLSKLVGKFPVFGNIVRGSERAYIGFLNKVRADTFNSLAKKYEDMGVDIARDKETLQGIARWINSASGRGHLGGKWANTAPAMAGLFFSPRLMKSRVDMLNPVFYAKLPKVVRQEAIKSMLAAGGIASTVVGLAAYMGADTSLDPRSSDFGKIKVGNTRYDVFGGFSQYLTLAARLASNQTVNARNEIKELGKEFGSRTRLDVLEQFFENKASPIASYIKDYLQGTDATGKPFNATTSTLERFIPLFLQDVYDMIEKYGDKGLFMAAPAILGVGIQDYSGKEYSSFERVFPDNSAKSATAKELNRLNEVSDKSFMSPAANSFSVEGIKIELSDSEKSALQKSIGTKLTESLKDIITLPEYKAMNDKQKIEVVREAIKEAKEEAKEEMLSKLSPETVEKVLKQIEEKQQEEEELSAPINPEELSN